MHQSENLPEVPIHKFTGFHNPEYKKKCTFYIGTVLSLHNFVVVQEEKCRGARRNCCFFFAPCTLSSFKIFKIIIYYGFENSEFKKYNSKVKYSF